MYVDTGAIYRTVGLAALEAGIASKDEAGVAALLPKLDISMDHDGDGLQRMLLGGRDVTSDIRKPEVSIYASDVSAMPPVRAYLLEMQRRLAREHNVIMDGRDIGTVVLPDADLKIFLTADAGERAQRRYDELLIRGIATSYDDVLRDILYRDENDSKRSISPLKQAEDAVLVDTTGNTLEQSFSIICRMIEENMNK